jgi:YVTN family beta-propeller protein
MAKMTGGTAVAERPTDSVWLSTLPTTPRPAIVDALPAVRVGTSLQRITRPAEGVLSGLPGAVTDLAVSRDGRHLVAAHYGQDTVTVIDVATLDVTAKVPGIAEPYAVSTIPVTRAAGVSIDTVRINRAGTRLYAALTTATGGALLMIDIRTGNVRTVPVGESIGDIAVDHNDRRVFMTGWDSEFGGVLRIVDTASARLVHTIAIGGLPLGLLVAGGVVYVADGEDVVVIDAATARVIDRSAIGRPVSCLAISQDGTHLFVGDYDGSVAAMPVKSGGLGLRAAS